MSLYKFKSSGKTSSQIRNEIQPVTYFPIGIKTPLSLDDKNLFAMHYNNGDQIHDNLKNLILTNWGERLGFYFFGANLRELTSELNSIDAFDSAAIERIKTAVSTWMPYVTLKNFSSNYNREENRSVGILKIMITYSVPQLKIDDRALQVSMHVI